MRFFLAKKEYDNYHFKLSNYNLFLIIEYNYFFYEKLHPTKIQRSGPQIH